MTSRNKLALAGMILMLLGLILVGMFSSWYVSAGLLIFTTGHNIERMLTFHKTKELNEEYRWNNGNN